MARIVSFAALVLLVCFTAQLAATSEFPEDNGLQLIRNDEEQVATSDNVTWTRKWQIKKSLAEGGGSEVHELETNVPGRVFISYDESLSSDLLAEVIIHGTSAKDVRRLELIGLEGYNGVSMVYFSEPGGVGDSALLLTELKLRHRRTIKRLSVMGPGDTVVLENVLSTKTKEDFEALQADLAAAASKSSGLELTEVPSAVDSRQWNITATNKNVGINLDLSLEGTAEFMPLAEGASADTIAVIRLSASVISEVPTEQLEVDHTQAGESEALQLRVKPTFNAKGREANVVTVIEVHPSVKLNVTHSAIRRISDRRSSVPADGFDFYMLMDLNGSVYISDKDAVLFLDGTNIVGQNGRLQLDVGGLSSTWMLVNLADSGEMNIFADSISTSNPIDTYADVNGRLCFSSSNDLTVTQLNAETSWFVAYTGKAKAPRKCVKRDLPERAPGQINGKGPSSWGPSSKELSSSSSSGLGETKTTSGVQALHVTSVVALSAVAMVVSLLL